VAWILYLLFFSKQYRPESKHDKLTKEVKMILWSRVKLISSKPYNCRLHRNTTMDNFNLGLICLAFGWLWGGRTGLLDFV